MKRCNPMLMTDFYKISHRIMSEKGTEKIYATVVPRTTRIEGIKEVVYFGGQGFNKEFLVDYFNDNFFKVDKDLIVADYKRMISFTLGEDCASTDHIEALHDLGYLPIEIKAVPEGTLVPLRVPMMTIENTLPDFYWLTNFLETLISTEMWRSITTATVAKRYNDLSIDFAKMTCDDNLHVQWQNHNFSYRGMSGNADATKTGASCLLFSTGTDSIPSIVYLENYYGANVEKELVAASVLATEHSIQCQYNDDYRYMKNMITNVAPSGIVSVVSDGYDYWNMIKDVLPKLKDVIMARDGKLVIRPDSGNPTDIICGTVGPWNGKNPTSKTLEEIGSIEALWNIFGGTINDKGFKVLDPHIGLIYGDAITPDVAKVIFGKLMSKGFASSNIVFGVGSYSLGFHTRDTFGMAVKATYSVINGEEVKIFKDPKTDSGIKKSLKGLCIVMHDDDGKIVVKDDLNLEQYEELLQYDIMQTVFKDSQIMNETTLGEIRHRLSK